MSVDVTHFLVHSHLTRFSYLAANWPLSGRLLRKKASMLFLTTHAMSVCSLVYIYILTVYRG